jgi:hypothetical protein
MTEKHQGSCLCGGARFEIAGAFERFFLCHCGRCRKGSGSAHGANLFATNAELTWLSGEGNVKSFALAGTRHARSFCSSCGSALPSVRGQLLVVPAGSLDTPVTKRPDAHICTASRADWDCALESVPSFEALPV